MHGNRRQASSLVVLQEVDKPSVEEPTTPGLSDQQTTPDTEDVKETYTVSQSTPTVYSIQIMGSAKNHILKLVDSTANNLYFSAGQLSICVSVFDHWLMYAVLCRCAICHC